MAKIRLDNILCYDRTKACPAYSDILFCLLTYTSDFRANVLALPIAVRPYHQCLRRSRFAL